MMSTMATPNAMAEERVTSLPQSGPMVVTV